MKAPIDYSLGVVDDRIEKKYLKSMHHVQKSLHSLY